MNPVNFDSLKQSDSEHWNKDTIEKVSEDGRSMCSKKLEK